MICNSIFLFFLFPLDIVDDCITNQSYVGSLLGWEYENNLGEQKKTCLLPSQVVNELYCEPNKLKKEKSRAGFEGKCNSGTYHLINSLLTPALVLFIYLFLKTNFVIHLL
jgi:hypothetical protein